jgi:Electron transfer DM13
MYVHSSFSLGRRVGDEGESYLHSATPLFLIRSPVEIVTLCKGIDTAFRSKLRRFVMTMQRRMIRFVSWMLMSAGAIVLPTHIHPSIAKNLPIDLPIDQWIAQNTANAAMEKNDAMMKKPTMMAKPDAMMKKPDGMMGKAGKFVPAEHPTQGMAKIVIDKGAAFIEFDSAFKTDDGPDLHVILYRTSQPPVKGIKEADYVNLGKLQKIAGSQRYAIPKNAKLMDYGSVAIWCQKFNATFGYAALAK